MTTGALVPVSHPPGTSGARTFAVSVYVPGFVQ
jgi:hypothetical protein